jgi:glucosamine-6-phosphate deaminase
MIDIRCYADKNACGTAAAALGAKAIARAISDHGQANIVVATGASQFEMLAALVATDAVDWSRVTAFHLDEYIGMPETHPASFRGYLKQRFTSKLPRLGAFHFIHGDAPDLGVEIERMNAILDRHPIDVMFAGIGENGHLAFNDPPADFETHEPYLVVSLDEACRRQQVGEGWFADLESVPREAISMSCRQILASRRILCVVPDARKAQAVRAAIEGPVTPYVPASILQTHDDVTVYLDAESASLLGAS